MSSKRRSRESQVSLFSTDYLAVLSYLVNQGQGMALDDLMLGAEAVVSEIGILNNWLSCCLGRMGVAADMMTRPLFMAIMVTSWMCIQGRDDSGGSGIFYSFGSAAGDTFSSRSDDGSSSIIPLASPLPFFGRTYQQIFVNQNGHITFNQSLSQYVPHEFPANSTMDIIASFWTDLDNRESGYISYQQYTSGDVLQIATQDISSYFPSVTFTASWVFVATWDRVAYYPNTVTEITFQVVLISDSKLAFILMNYGDIAPTKMQVQIGYDTISSTHYGSLRTCYPNNIIDIVNLKTSSNVNVQGRWAFLTTLQSTSFSCTNTPRLKVPQPGAVVNCSYMPDDQNVTCTVDYSDVEDPEKCRVSASYLCDIDENCINGTGRERHSFDVRNVQEGEYKVFVRTTCGEACTSVNITLQDPGETDSSKGWVAVNCSYMPDDQNVTCTVDYSDVEDPEKCRVSASYLCDIDENCINGTGRERLSFDVRNVQEGEYTVSVRAYICGVAYTSVNITLQDPADSSKGSKCGVLLLLVRRWTTFNTTTTYNTTMLQLSKHPFTPRSPSILEDSLGHSRSRCNCSAYYVGHFKTQEALFKIIEATSERH